jgi:hypothetical protein
MKHLNYYKQRKSSYGPKSVQVYRNYLGDSPRIPAFINNNPLAEKLLEINPKLVRAREYLDEDGNKRYTIEIEL